MTNDAIHQNHLEILEKCLNINNIWQRERRMKNPPEKLHQLRDDGMKIYMQH